MAGLQNNLSELHACLRSDNPADNAQKAHDIIGDIGHTCLQDVTERDIDYACSVLFAKDTGAVTFLRNAVKHDEYQSAKFELVEILMGFTSKWPRRVVPYAVDIKDACMALFARDKFSKVKCSALNLLIVLLTHVPGSKAANDLDAKKVIEKLFMELTQPTKHTSTVKQLLFHLLGVLAEVYPEEATSYSERLGDTYVRTMNTEMKSKTKKPDLPIIAGCLQGLCHYLVNFTQSADEGAKHSFDIYRAAKKAIGKDIQYTRYELPKAGMLLLAKHAPQFNVYILDDYEILYDNLKFWSSHNNRDMLHAGTSAMQAILAQVSEMLINRANEGKQEGGTFKFFIQKFRAIMDNPNASNKEVSLAIKGYGLFAAPCKIFLSTKDVQFMFNEMMQRCDQIFFDQSGVADDRVMSLPSYLEALASIIRQLDEVSETFVWSLERLVVVLMENIPKIHFKMHHDCLLSILRVFHALMPKGAIFRVFLAKVVYQSVIRTCSHPVVLVTEESSLETVTEQDVTADDVPTISYRSYMGMWADLLNTNKFKVLLMQGVSLAERTALTELLYAELLSAVLHVLNRLDLGSQRDGEQELDGEPGTSDVTNHGPQENVTSDPVLGLQASKPKDFVVFINLVDFCRDLLPNHHTHLFKSWVFKFGNDLILYSTKYPLVSGFYKLLGMCMSICTKIAYFKDIGCGDTETEVRVKEEQSEEEDESMDVDEHEADRAQRVQCESCFLLFSKFTKEVLTRLKQYKDDLLASCLTFVLSLPREIVCAEINSIIPALQMALRLGVSYLTLALVGLDALERWKRTLPEHVIRPHYAQILPCLDPYLKTRRDQDSDSRETLLLTSKGKSRKSGKRRLPVKLLEQTWKDAVKGQETQLEQVQQRCLTLLGSLGGSTNHHLLSSSPEQLGAQAVAWDNVRHLKFDMPFMDVKPVIYFDPFLPRVAELATTSSERQTKVAACELLHSLVLYMIGRGVQKRAGDLQGDSMEKLYRKLFPVIVTLACDVEQVAKQLFEPLMLQLIHWFTGNKKYESDDTMALLDTLIDGIVDPTDTARRDFSAKCLKEFLVWSIKQTSKEQMGKSPGNMKSLLKRMYSLAHHPSAFKRLGSALAFNSIYSVFREEDSLVDMFTFQILANYIDSLALAHYDDKSLGTQEQCRKVLTHVERIIKHKAGLLSKPSKHRIVPREWNDATLLTATRWLIRQCGRPHAECRHAAMQLICNLAPFVQNINTAKDFFTALQKESGPEYFIVRFERGRYKLQSRSGLVQCQVMSRLGDSFSLKFAVNWYDMLLATLDCYTWVFGQNLLNPAKTLVVSGNKGTVLFKVLTHFLDDLALEDISAAANLFEVRPEVMLFTPHERDEYNRVKCTAIVRLMDFIVVLLGLHQKDSLKVVPGSFWSPTLWELIVRCVIQPTKVGFNMADVEVMMKLPEQMAQVLQVIGRLPANVLKGFTSCLTEKLAKGTDCDLSSKLPLSLTSGDENQFSTLHLVNGLTQLETLGLLHPAISHVGDRHKFAERLLQSVFRGVATKEDDHLVLAQLDPQSIDLAAALLRLAFTIGLKPKAILDVLLDKTPLHQPGLGTCQQGAVFYAQFGAALDRHLLGMAADFIPALVYHANSEWSLVGSVLTGMLDKASKEKVTRKKEGKTLVKLVLDQWRHLSCWWSKKSGTQETKIQALQVLTKTLVLDSKVVIDSESGNFGDIFDMYQDLLTDRDTGLAFKCRVLDLLVFFVNVPDHEVKKLKASLDRLVTDNFPMRSSEFTVGTPKHSDYITALNKILSALDLSGSLMLLELLISIMCRETPHVHEDEIQSTLVRFMKRMPMDKHKLALDVPYNIFRKEGSYPDCIRRASLERVCLPLLRIAHKGALTEFFSSSIKEIMATLEMKLNKSSEDVFSTQLISKICAFELLEVMYSRLPKDDVFTKTAQINATYCNQRLDTGKELTTAITKLSNQAKGEDCRGEVLCADLRRQFHCAAYNTLIATISCTQTDMKFYNGFLFNENLAKGQFLLDNIVDKEKSYTFQVEMETLHQRKKRFVSIRNEVRERKMAEAEEERETTSVHYLASQYLADSSLSTDVSQFDFGSSATTASISGSISGDRRPKMKKKDSGYEEPKVTIEADYVEMEMDELNQHECMATMTALLQHMKRNNISPATEKGVSPTSMPPWMENLHKKMKHRDTAINVKLFLAKLVINTEEVFRPYARFWLAPLVLLIVGGETRSPGVHYLVVDIVVTILSWHTVAIPEDTAVDRGMASSLLEFLLKNCHHNERRILRNNLDVIKTLIEVWKDRLDIPYKIIYDNFSTPDKGTSNVTGIQMLGVILANKLPPYSTACGVNKDRFFQHLAMNMNNTSKRVYEASAEVVGMSLKYMADRERSESDRQWQDNYISNIAKMLLSIQMSKPDVFVTCVYRMQLHHPPLVDKFISKVLFLLPRLHGEFRIQCLEIIMSRADHIDNLFTEMKNKNLHSLLTHRDEGCQLVTLKLVQTMLAKIKAEELLSVLSAIGAFSKHPSAACRAVMYDVLMWIYDNYREEDTPAGHSIMTATKDGLLFGLSDDDLKNRLTVQNFWSHETRLPTSTVDRMVAMLEAMYSPRTERQYLAYATNLLLEMTSKSPDYNRAIFEHPLSECRFEDYAITSSWRQRHAAMTPLFVATQMSQSQGETSFTSEDLSGQVRATQDVANFTPTQQPGASKAPYNWLTQSSLDTFSDYNLTLPSTTDTQSSLLFTVGKPSAPRSKRHAAPGAGFGRGRVGGGARDEQDGANGESGKGSEILRLKKRFLKDQQSSQKYFAKKNARLKQLREDVRKEQQLRRENMVTMYRKYRAGDLPDVQIKYSYVIAPLQALAQKDNHIGRLLFGSLFKSIFPEIEVVKTEREAREMITQITTSLNTMLNNSVQYCPNFIACILDIALEFPRRLKLEPNAVNTACLTGQQQPIGIVLLEETLIYSADDLEERPTKRARGAGSAMTQVSKDTATWIELARMYKSLGDYDVLRGIFSSRVGTQGLTGKALDAEMSGDYKLALSLYNEGLDRTDWDETPPKEAELDLWDTSRLECCAHLADWTKLEQFTTQAIDEHTPPNLDLVWEDTYFQEHYLPYIIRGRLKLLMEGGDQQILLDFIDRALHVPERKALLESTYCEELALLYMWQEDYDRARHFCTAAEQGFLQEWGSLNSLMENSRSTSLQRVQKLTELKEFLTCMAHESNFQSITQATHLIHRWLRRSPDPILDSEATWDDIITNRNVYLDHISCRLETAGVKDEPDGVSYDPWARHKVSLWLSQANSARLQNNFVVALKQIRRAYKVVKAASDDDLFLQWAEAYASVHIRRSQVAPLSADDRLRAATVAFDQLEKHKDSKLLAQNTALGTKHYVLKGTAVQEMTSVLQDSLTLTDIEDDIRKKVVFASGNINAADVDKVICGLVEQGFQHIKLAVSVADRSGYVEPGHDVTGVNDAHMAFVRYCDHYLQQAEDDDKSYVKSTSFANFHVAIVTSLLAAMRLGSVEARQRFPRLLQVVEKFPDTIDIFIRKAALVPCWMYLSWVAQLTAVLDKPESPAVHQLLLNMAKTYPEALVYPFKLSDDGYNFSNTPVGKKSKVVRDQIEEILAKKKLVNVFIGALEQFGQPNALFKDWYDDIARMLSAKPGQRQEERILVEFQQMYADLMDRTGPSEDDLYDTQQESSTSQIPTRVAMGKYRRRFAEKHAVKVERLCGKDGRKLLSMTSKSFREGIVTIIEEMNQVASSTLAPPLTLKEYSQWLADFQAANYDQDLEIPGQYTGHSKPLPEDHVKINSFDERVVVMSSIRKPKRIAIRGNDEREYLYLVKGGEDLRQDQRVEQLFAIMNDVFAHDATCRQRKYSVRTYQVIPMTARVGMIEWMKKTIPLKDFLQDAMTPQEKTFYGSQKGPWADHIKFIGGSGKDDYFRSYENHSRSDTVNAFRRREESVPSDLSRRAYRNLSASPEAYFTLRSNFAVSHALVSICQYLLGIGDRHTSNFMIDLVTGCMVGIDFGHAFGSATTFLPIPELMPLRMTRQLRCLLLPLREKGLIEGTMVHALRALRNNSHLLLATMDVFIKEPSLDWQQNSERQRRAQGIKDDSDLETNWYPKEKISVARRKLQGHHPTYITRDELSQGHKRNKACRHIERVLMGDREHDIRARLPERDLTVEQQVACLLNQATDPNILGRVYVGWNSWM